MDEAGCKAEGIVCGAVKMGASIATAVAMAYYM